MSAREEVAALSSDARLLILLALTDEGLLSNPENGQPSEWRIADAGKALGGLALRRLTRSRTRTPDLRYPGMNACQVPSSACKPSNRKAPMSATPDLTQRLLENPWLSASFKSSCPHADCQRRLPVGSTVCPHAACQRRIK